MTIAEILLAVGLGLLVNECTELSRWVARRLLRWAVHRRYSDPDRAAVLAEDQAAYLNDCPGKLLQLVMALGFAARALATRKGITPSDSTTTDQIVHMSPSASPHRLRSFWMTIWAEPSPMTPPTVHALLALADGAALG